MNEKALGNLIIFTGLFVLTIFSTRWMYGKIRFLTDKSPMELSAYRKKVWYNPKRFYDWLIENTAEEAAVRKLFIGYYLCKLPALIGLFISIIGLFTHRADSFMDMWSFVVIAFNIIVAVIGGIQGSRRMKR